MKLNWNFQRGGGGGGLRKNPFRGRGMDIFWNYTMMAQAKRIYIFIIKVNKLFSFFLLQCFLKEI